MGNRFTRQINNDVVDNQKNSSLPETPQSRNAFNFQSENFPNSMSHSQIRFDSNLLDPRFNSSKTKPQSRSFMDKTIENQDENKLQDYESDSINKYDQKFQDSISDHQSDYYRAGSTFSKHNKNESQEFKNIKPTPPERSRFDFLCCSTVDRHADNPFEFNSRRKSENQHNSFSQQKNMIRTHLASGGYESYMDFQQVGMTRPFLNSTTQKFSSDQFRSPQPQRLNFSSTTDPSITPVKSQISNRSRNLLGTTLDLSRILQDQRNQLEMIDKQTNKSTANNTGINLMMNEFQDQFREDYSLSKPKIVKKKVLNNFQSAQHSRNNTKFTKEMMIALQNLGQNTQPLSHREDRFLSEIISPQLDSSLYNHDFLDQNSSQNSNRLQLNSAVEELDAQIMMEGNSIMIQSIPRRRFDSTYYNTSSNSKQSLAQQNIINARKNTLGNNHGVEFDNDSQYNIFLKELSVDFQLDYTEEEYYLQQQQIQSIELESLSSINHSQSQSYEKIRDQQASSPPSHATSNIEVETEIIPRSSNEIRNRLMAKLTHRNILKMTPNKIKKQSLIIFDWDDTLFFTSAVKPETESDIKLIQKTYKLSLQQLDDIVVAIVTNAKKSWVYLCSERLMPKTFKIIQKSILVVSARDNFKNATVRNAPEWKLKTFTDLLNNGYQRFKVERDIITNLVVIGDQINEIQAGQILSKQVEKCLYKSVKLSEQPCITELLKQLKIVTDKWEYIVNYHKCLEVELSRKLSAEVKKSDPVREMTKSNYFAHYTMPFGSGLTF